MKIRTLVLSLVSALSLAPVSALATDHGSNSARQQVQTRARAARANVRRIARSFGSVSAAQLRGYGDTASDRATHVLNSIAEHPSTSVRTFVRSATATALGVAATAADGAAWGLSARESRGDRPMTVRTTLAQARIHAPLTAAGRGMLPIPGADIVVGKVAGYAAQRMDAADDAPTHQGATTEAGVATAVSAALTYGLAELSGVAGMVRGAGPAAKLVRAIAH